jgi:hypothetical protein
MTENVRNYLGRIKDTDASTKQTIDSNISVLKSIAQRYDNISERDLITEYLNAVENAVIKARKDYLKESDS